MIKGFNHKAKFYFILLKANMLENISVFKVRGRQACSVKLPDCPLCTFIDCALGPPYTLTYEKQVPRRDFSDIFIKLSWQEAHESHFFFLFTPGAFDEGSDPAATAVTRWLPPPLRGPFSSPLSFHLHLS